MRGITNSEDVVFIINTIKKHIIPKEGYNPDNTTEIDVVQADRHGIDRLAECIFEYYLNRTQEHVQTVQIFAKMIADKHSDREWSAKLLEQAKDHDKDKLTDIEFMANYAPYIVKKYGPEELKCNFELTEEYKKEWDRKWVVQHCKNNKHHPEGWDKSYDYGENNPPYTPKLMDEVSMSEMCADWMSVGYEQGNSATEWFEKTNGSRWNWSNTQKTFIRDILKDEASFLTRIRSVGTESLSQTQHYLYTYVPKNNTVAKDGVYGPCGDSEEELVRRYGYRANSNTKEGVLRWLDSTFPGRSKCISVLTEPIPDTASPKQKAFRDNSVLVVLPSYEELKKLGIVVDLYQPHLNGPGSDKVKEVDYSPIPWSGKEGKLTFSGIKHYFIVTKTGAIPAKYCKIIKGKPQMSTEGLVSSKPKTVWIDSCNMSEARNNTIILNKAKYIDLGEDVVQGRYIWSCQIQVWSSLSSLKRSIVSNRYRTWHNDKYTYAVELDFNSVKDHLKKIGNKVYIIPKSNLRLKVLNSVNLEEVYRSNKNIKLSAESLSPSTEAIPVQYSRLVFENTPTKKKIYSLFRPYYSDTGSHGYDHIKEVLTTAYVLKGKKDLTDLEYTAILLHDVGRKYEDESKGRFHNVISEEIARKELPKLNLFSEEELEQIYKAVLYHRSTWRKEHGIEDKDLDPLSELVSNADKGFPQTTYYDICLRPTLWILEGNDRTANPEKMARLHNYATVDDIAQGVIESLERIAKKRFDPNDTSLHARVFAKEKKLQLELRSKITLEIAKETVIQIMKDYGYAKQYSKESLSISYSNENLESNWYTKSDIIAHATPEVVAELKSHIGKYLYHGAPIKYDKLSPQKRGDTEDPVLFLSPFPYMASLFCTEYHHVRKGLYDNKLVSINSWVEHETSYDGLEEPALVVDIGHNIKDLKPVTIVDYGYVHAIRSDRIIDNILPYNRWSQYYECVYFGKPITPDKVVKVKQTIKIHFEPRCVKEQGGYAIPCSSYVARVTYDGIGIYEALKLHMTPSEWMSFKKSEAATWLPLPELKYTSSCRSYFTERGFDKFMKLTKPYMDKYLEQGKIVIMKYGKYLDWEIMYSDKYQIVTDGSERQLSSTEKYDPPYNAEQMRKHGYSEEIIARLEKDPVHSWRMKTGIELIHIEPSKSELMRIWKNWNQMSAEQKKISEKKELELFGVTNKGMYNYLLPQYKVENPDRSSIHYPPRQDSSEESLIGAGFVALGIYVVGKAIVNSMRRKEEVSEWVRKVKTWYIASSGKSPTGEIYASPKKPNDPWVKAGIKDGTTPRACCYPTIDAALAATHLNYTGKTVYIYGVPSLRWSGFKLNMPSKDVVPDANITHEMWSAQELNGKYYCTVKVSKPKRVHKIECKTKDGKKITVQTTKWNYSIIDGKSDSYAKEDLGMPMESLSFSTEGFVDNLKKAFVGRRTYHNLFDFMEMQGRTSNVYNHKFDLSKLNDPESISKTENKDAVIIFEKLQEDIHDYDYPDTEEAIRSVANSRYNEELHKSPRRDTVKLPSVKRSDVTLSTAGYKERVQHITKRLKELTAGKAFADKSYSYQIKRFETNLKNADSAVADKRYLPYVKKVLTFWLTESQNDYAAASKFYEFYIKEYELELNYLTAQASAESLSVSTEAALPANFKEKRKKIEKYILDSIKLLDPHTDVNSSYWSNKFKSMSDQDFDKFMHYLQEHKCNIHMFVPPLKVKLKTSELMDAAHKLGVKLMHRIWMTDANTGLKYLTPEEYMVLQLPVRRQQQFLDEKISVPDNDKTIDGLTGQVTGDSKACAITNPEIHIMQARNLNASLYEFANVRGGNIHSYAEFKRALEETGSVSLNQLDPNNKTRVAVMGQVLLTAMGLDSNLTDI